MALQFKNADVASKYESDFDRDPVVHIPAEADEKGQSKGNGYKGSLSEITVDHAQRLIKQESNLVREKKPSSAISSNNTLKPSTANPS
jgi:hypothetical protein